MKKSSKFIPVVLIDPDYEEDITEKPLKPHEIKNLLARGYTLVINGLGHIKMDFTPRASVVFKPNIEVDKELRKIYKH